jgi:hypothetical protein
MSSPESGIGRGILRGILWKDGRGLPQIQFAQADDNDSLCAAVYIHLAVDMFKMQHFEFTGDS